MNIRDYLTVSGSFFKRIFGGLKRAIDRDIYKTAVHPDEDWRHILIMFLASVALFVFLGIYFYLNIQLQKLKLTPKTHTPIVVVDEVKKIKQAITMLEESEKNLSEVIETVPKVNDPSL